jgi:hypothetical protein
LAPDIAGQNKANPLGAIGSVGAMLAYSFGLKEESAAVESAIEKVLASGHVTADLRPPGTPATTEQVGEAVCAATYRCALSHNEKRNAGVRSQESECGFAFWLLSPDSCLFFYDHHRQTLEFPRRS